MSNANAPTRSVVVQTTLRVTENSDEGTLVVSDRGCQTAIVAHPSSTDLNLLPLLEFIPYSEIDKGGIRVIKLPKKALLQFDFSGNPPTRNLSEVNYKSVLKKSLSNNISSSLHLPHHPSATPMAKIFEDQICQTDLSVSPYILDEDAVANVRREIGAQTSVTFEPSATISDVEPRLKEYLSHSHCFVAIYLQGKFTNLEDYEKQTGQYEPVAEVQEAVIADDDVSRTIPQQTEISISKPQKTKKVEQEGGSLDYRHMTDEEFEENIGKILNRTVKNVTALMNRVVAVYERSHPDSQKIDKTKETESSDDSVYFSSETDEINKVELKEIKELEAESIKETESEEETKENDPEEIKKVESEEVKSEEIKEIEPKEIKEVEPVEIKHDKEVDVDKLRELPDEEIVSELTEPQIEQDPTVSKADDVKDIKQQEETDRFDDIEPEIRSIIERLLQSREVIHQIISSPVGDTPAIRRKTHIECECAHPSEAGAAPPTLTPPTLREEPKRETPETAKDTERIVVEAVEGKPVTLELIVKPTDGVALRDSISCPETCSATCSDLNEQIIRLSVVLPKQHTIPCTSIDNKQIQATQSDTQIYVSQKPSTLPCGCPSQSKGTQPAPAVITQASVCTNVEEIVCGDRILEICEAKMEDKCVPCTEEVDECVPCTEEVDECMPCTEKVLFKKPAMEICNCLSMQSYEQCGIVSLVEETRKNAQFCECSKPLKYTKSEFCCCFELPFSDDEDDSPEDYSCGRICPVHFPLLTPEEKICTCGEPIEIIYPKRSICSCDAVYSESSICLCGREKDFEVSEICSYCRNLQETADICVCGDGSDVRTYGYQEEKSAICSCEELSQEKISKTSTITSTYEQTFLKIPHPEGQDLSEKEIQDYWNIQQDSCSNVCNKSVEAQTMFTKDSICLIYQQSRNIVEPYMDKLREYKTETPQVREPSLLYLTDRKSIEQYMKTLDPEDARDMMISRIPIPKKSSIENVGSKQMTLIAVEIASTIAQPDGPKMEEDQSLRTNVTVRAAAWKVGEELHTAFDSSFVKDTLTYVTNEEEVDVVERDSKSSPFRSTHSTAIGPDVGITFTPGRVISSEGKREKEVVKERESVKFLFVSSVEKQVATPTQSQPILESKLTPDPTQITNSKPEFLSNLDTYEMPCKCQQDATDLASYEPTPNLTCLFEDDSEYHEGYMEEMTEENVSVQTELKFVGGKIPLVECAGSLPDMVNDTNRCDSKIEMPWLRISLPPAGYYQIEKMDGRPKKKTCDCWKLDTRDSVFLAEPVVQRVICPTKTPDEYKSLNLDGGDENITGDSEDDTPGYADLTDHKEAEGILQDDQPSAAKAANEDQPKEEEEEEEEKEEEEEEEEIVVVSEDQSKKEEEDASEDRPKKEEGVGEDQPAKSETDKTICVCLLAAEEDDCAEFKKPMKFVYDDLCYEANEGYMDALYKLYPDDCDTECGSKTEIPWENIILPTRVKLRATKKKKQIPKFDVSDVSERPRQEREFIQLYANAAVKGVTETPSGTKSEKSARSDKSIQSQKFTKTGVTKQRAGLANSTVEIELSFAEVVSNLINIEDGAATQATVSQISAISDIRMTPKRCPKDYIITVQTTAGVAHRFGGGKMQIVGSQPFDFKIDEMTAPEINLATVASKIPEKTKSCGVNYEEPSVLVATKRKAKSMPDVPSKSSNISGAFTKILTLKSGEEASIDMSQNRSHGKEGKDETYKPVRVRISKESSGVSSSLKTKDPIVVVLRSTSSRESRGSHRSTRAQDNTSEGKETKNPITKSSDCKEARCSCRSLGPKYPALGFLDVRSPVRTTASKESRSTCRSLEPKRPLIVPLDVKEPIRSTSSRESRPKDPIMEALETYQQEMKPLRESLNRLKAKIRDLNLPELSSWTCRPLKSRSRMTPTPCTSIYGRTGVSYPPGSPYGMPPPMGFGMGPVIPPSYYPPGQFNFMPPQNMYYPQPFRPTTPPQFQTYPHSGTMTCKRRRSKSRTCRRHRRQISSKSSSEMSDYSPSENANCPFLGTTSAVSCASLPKSPSSKVNKRLSKAVCTCRQKRQRQVKTEAKTRRNQTNTECIEKGTRTEPEMKIHFAPRDSKTARSRCKAVQHVVDKAPAYVKNDKLHVAVRIAPGGGGFPETENPSGEDSCACRD